MFAEPCGPKTERGGLLAETPKPPRFRLWEPLYIAQSGARPVLASAKPGADSRFWALFSAREMSAAVIHVSRLFPGNICLKAGRPRGVAELAKERDPAARPLATRPRKGLRGPNAGIAAHREGGQGLRVSEARTGACRSEGERGWSTCREWGSQAQRSVPQTAACDRRREDRATVPPAALPRLQRRIRKRSGAEDPRQAELRLDGDRGARRPLSPSSRSPAERSWREQTWAARAIRSTESRSAAQRPGFEAQRN